MEYKSISDGISVPFTGLLEKMLYRLDLAPMAFFPTDNKYRSAQIFVQHISNPDAYKTQSPMYTQKVGESNAYDPLAANTNGHREGNITGGLQIAYKNNVEAASQLEQNFYQKHLLTQCNYLRISAEKAK